MNETEETKNDILLVVIFALLLTIVMLAFHDQTAALFQAIVHVVRSAIHAMLALVSL